MLDKATRPSSNWLALRKTLARPHKRRKTDRDRSPGPSDAPSADTSTSRPKRRENEHVDLETPQVKNGESIAALRRMVLGRAEYDSLQSAPGKYVGLDCEMVGVGIEGKESSLARVSMVNYRGAIILDVFVRQRERVVDYRTQWSGVRGTDLRGSARPFKDVQQTVADLIKDRILVGHAIHNDLKALLLSHPSGQIRDTQSLAYKHRAVKSRRPALRVLVKQELGIVIQGGEHNSVTDARATMALFRLHKKQWESGFRSLRTSAHSRRDDSTSKVTASHPSTVQGKKRSHSESDDDEADEVAIPSSSVSHTPARTVERRKQSTSPSPASPAQRKGISSGISTVITRPDGTKQIQRKTKSGREKDGIVRESSKGGKKTGKSREKWWNSLGGSKKGSVKF